MISWMWLPAIIAVAYFLGVLSILAFIFWISPDIFKDKEIRR
jgi:hypothetical protein